MPRPISLSYLRIGLTSSSNAIEGNSLTESETKVVIEDGIAIIPPVLRAQYIQTLEKAHEDDSYFVQLIAEAVRETQRDYLRLFI